MRYKRNSIWGRWDINKLCIIDNNINTDMLVSELRVGKNNGKTVLNINDRDRVSVNSSIYSNGRVGVLCIL